jgi:hypothetical protein
MKILNFELIVEKTPDGLNRRVNARVAEGWELMLGCSGMNTEVTKFAACMVLPVPAKPRRSADVEVVPAGTSIGP